jgi:predicted transcriptional regulator
MPKVVSSLPFGAAGERMTRVAASFPTRAHYGAVAPLLNAVSSFLQHGQRCILLLKEAMAGFLDLLREALFVGKG